MNRIASNNTTIRARDGVTNSFYQIVMMRSFLQVILFTMEIGNSGYLSDVKLRQYLRREISSYSDSAYADVFSTTSE